MGPWKSPSATVPSALEGLKVSSMSFRMRCRPSCMADQTTGGFEVLNPKVCPSEEKNIMSTIHILCIGCEVNHISFFQAILLNSDSSQGATRFNWSTRLQHQRIVSPLVHHINPWPTSDTLQRKRTAQVNHSMYLDVSIISTDILWIMAAD